MKLQHPAIFSIHWEVRSNILIFASHNSILIETMSSGVSISLDTYLTDKSFFPLEKNQHFPIFLLKRSPIFRSLKNREGCKNTHLWGWPQNMLLVIADLERSPFKASRKSWGCRKLWAILHSSRGQEKEETLTITCFVPGAEIYINSYNISMQKAWTVQENRRKWGDVRSLSVSASRSKEPSVIKWPEAGGTHSLGKTLPSPLPKAFTVLFCFVLLIFMAREWTSVMAWGAKTYM